MATDTPEIAEVLNFWFNELEPRHWWSADPAVDAAVRTRFGSLYELLVKEVPAGWPALPRGCLAAVIVLDQFPRNMFRNDARAFGTDGKALAIAREAIERGFDAELTQAERQFLYLPFQHSEDIAVQAESVALFERLGDGNALDFARRHKAVIDRFGRFPHRNAVLGRKSTQEEQAFLAQHGRGF